MRGQLQEFIRSQAHAEEGARAEVNSLKRLAGGASCDVYAFEVTLSRGQAPRRLVLRIDREGNAIGSDRRREFDLFRAAAQAGVTVPRVYWYGDQRCGLGRPFFVMEYVEGEAIARRLLRDDAYSGTRKVLPSDLARELARAHQCPLDAPGVAEYAKEAPLGGRQADAVIDYWYGVFEQIGAGHPWPVLEMVARWLRSQAPSDSERTLVHGDFRIGNIMFDRVGLTAVLDWELAHVGDPIEDLGWFCVRSWRFGVEGKDAGGLCSREEFAALYEQASGRRVPPERLRYWEIFGNWKWAIACIGQERAHKGGAYPSIELASIGRRVAEMEYEMLQLMEEV